MNEFFGKLIGIAIVFALWFVTAYALIGFVYWDWNVASWNDGQRTYLTLFSICLTVLTLFINGGPDAD